MLVTKERTRIDMSDVLRDVSIGSDDESTAFLAVGFASDEVHFCMQILNMETRQWFQRRPLRSCSTAVWLSASGKKLSLIPQTGSEWIFVPSIQTLGFNWLDDEYPESSPLYRALIKQIKGVGWDVDEVLKEYWNQILTKLDGGYQPMHGETAKICSRTEICEDLFALAVSNIKIGCSDGLSGPAMARLDRIMNNVGFVLPPSFKLVSEIKAKMNWMAQSEDDDVSLIIVDWETDRTSAILRVSKHPDGHREALICEGS